MARRIVLLAVVGVVGLAAYVAPGLGAKANDPGVTKTNITIGGTYPLSGFASIYGTIPKAATAYYTNYFKTNTINGRKLTYIYLDDQYDPQQTVTQTKKLVESDHVFGIFGSLGTQPNLAIEKYLDSRKVPQVLLATGDAFWSQPKPADVKSKTGTYWTFGGLGTYSGEAKLFAAYLNKNVKGGKIGVLYQNDNYGKPYLAALKKYLGSGGDKIVKAEPYDGTPGASTDVTQQMVALKASGANVFYAMSLPIQTINALVAENKLGWKPKATVVNAVASSSKFMDAAAAAGADINGDLSSGEGPNPNDPANAGLATVKQYKQIMAKYYPSGDVTDPNNFAGMAGAWLTVYVLQHAGNPPTRLGLMNALTHLNIKGGTGPGQDPYLYTGYTIHTTPTNRFLLPESKVIKWSGGKTGLFRSIGPLVGGLTG
jgi:ABC-type branched-subunit amino acid transport system substrate-binding protein